jgi:hypothetical protein
MGIVTGEIENLKSIHSSEKAINIAFRSGLSAFSFIPS